MNKPYSSSHPKMYWKRLSSESKSRKSTLAVEFPSLVADSHKHVSSYLAMSHPFCQSSPKRLSDGAKMASHFAQMWKYVPANHDSHWRPWPADNRVDQQAFYITTFTPSPTIHRPLTNQAIKTIRQLAIDEKHRFRLATEILLNDLYGVRRRSNE